MGFEHGPFLAQQDGGLIPNPLSWNKKHTVVYFEQPAGVGFSWSSVPADYDRYDDNVAAADNAAFLTAFFAQYPQYQSLPLFLTSESYGGNYIPQAARVVLDGADARLAAQLKKGGLAVGNPVFSIDEQATFSDIMSAVTAEILFGRALLPLEFVTRYRAANCSTLNQPPACGALTTEMFALAGTCWEGNTYEGNDCGDNMYSSPYGNASLGLAVAPTQDVDAQWTQWLNRPDVQLAIHAKPPRAPWGDCSSIGYNVTWPSNLPDYAAAFREGLKVLLFSGDVDVTTCPFASTQVAVEALTKLPGGQVTQPWSAWTAAGVAGNQTAGYLEIHKAFAFATIKGAGHEAPGFEPLASFELINAFTRGNLEGLLASSSRSSSAAAAAAPRARTQGSVLREALQRTRAAKGSARR